MSAAVTTKCNEFAVEASETLRMRIVLQGLFFISPPRTATLSWWRGLRALVIHGAMVSGPVYPWWDL